MARRLDASEAERRTEPWSSFLPFAMNPESGNLSSAANDAFFCAHGEAGGPAPFLYVGRRHEGALFRRKVLVFKPGPSLEEYRPLRIGRIPAKRPASICDWPFALSHSGHADDCPRAASNDMSWNPLPFHDLSPEKITSFDFVTQLWREMQTPASCQTFMPPRVRNRQILIDESARRGPAVAKHSDANSDPDEAPPSLS